MPATTRMIVIGPTPPPAHGVSVMTLTLLEALEREGRVAAHLDTKDPRPIETVGRLDLRNVWLALLHLARLQRLLARHRGAAVYVPVSQGTWGFLRDATFLLSARLWRRRAYVHLHGGYFGTFNREAGPPMRLLIRAALRGVHQAWVLTPGLREEFDGLVDPDRIAVLENAIEDPGLPTSGRDHDRADAATLRVLYLANLIPEKGCFDLIEAIELLGERARGIHVRFVGDASEAVERELERRGAALAAHGVEVELAGVLTGPDRDAQYAWADVFAFPTRYPYEGQPLVLLEALAAGLPIVSTRHNGVPETVRDGEEALLVDPGDAAALADVLARLRDDPALRDALGEHARARFEQRYRTERFRDDLLRLTAA